MGGDSLGSTIAYMSLPPYIRSTIFDLVGRAETFENRHTHGTLAWDLDEKTQPALLESSPQSTTKTGLTARLGMKTAIFPR